MAIGTLSQGDKFGSGVAAPGDLDGDGLPDLLVDADEDDTGASFAGAIYALFLQANGEVKSGPGNVQKLANGIGGLPEGTVMGGDVFGWRSARWAPCSMIPACLQTPRVAPALVRYTSRS